MIDATAETLISISEAGRILSIDGRATNPATLWKWTAIGRGPERIRLETIKVGGRTCTSCEALQRFVAALNPDPTITPAPVRTPSARARAAAAAAKELQAMGV